MKYFFIYSLIFLLISCGSEETPQNIELAGTPIQVTSQKVTTSADESSSFTLSGTVSAQKLAQISTRVMGTVTQVLVQEGQNVRQGQTLATVDHTDLKAQKARIQAQISEAEAALKSANRDHERFKNLYASKSITQKELNDVELQLEITQARVKAAKEALKEINVQLGYANIVAPFSGKIAQKMVQQGNMANPGMPLFSIESAGNLLVVVDVPASEIKHLQLKDEVEIWVQDVDQVLKGKISLINASSANRAHQYRVEISPSFTKANQNILSGMTAKVVFQKKEEEKNKMLSENIWIPATALVQQGQLKGVYTVSAQNTAMLRWVRVGQQTKTQVEVLSGLAKDDVLIVSATERLYNGAKITQ